MTPRKPSKSSPLTEENSDSTGTPRPNSRSSEIVDPMRRSFTGNPFQKPSIVANPRGFNPVTPANSPSDWAVRGRESNTMRFLRESEEKENSRDSNNQMGPAAKSPSKGMKNFMSPTISAALKINASPSKKILTERNSHDQSLLRSSVTSWDVRSSFSSISNLSETLEESETRFDKELDLKGAVLDPTVGTADSLPESNDIVDDLKPSCPSALEAIDADSLSPMPPPYDPKTNFLAPRPKFLYYKPKKEMDCNPLDGDDGLFSDSFSESEATEETESDCSQNESVDVVSPQVVVAKEEEEEEEEAAAYTEPNLHRSPGIEKESVMEKERSRQHLFTGSKCILSAFILILIACSTMIETDHHLQKAARSYNSMIKESSFPVALEVVSKKTEYLRRLVGANLRLWCDFSASYFGGLMSELRGEYQLGHVVFFNLTNLEEKKMKSLVKEADSEISMMIPEQNVQIEAGESDPDSRIEAEVEVDVVEERSEYDEISSSIEFELDDDNENSSCTTDEEEVKSVEGEEEEEEEEEEAVVQSSIEEEEEEVIAVVEEKIIVEEPELVTIQSGEVEEQKVICSVEEENILEEVEESEIVVATEKESELPQVEELIPTDDIKIVSQHSAEAEVPESIESSSSNRMTQIAALSSLILSLVAGCVAFKKIRSSSSSSSSMVNAAQAEQEEEDEEEEEDILGGAAKKFNISPVSGNNNLMAAFDCVGDSSSWPSEISLEEHKGMKNRSGVDPLMNPRKSSSRRRESVAASSSSDMSVGGSVSPSLSYGSFTTYEMIPTKKKRNGDEELVITPIRRSSRLRK